TRFSRDWSSDVCSSDLGQTYYLVVDNFSMSTNGFTLQWSGTAELLSPFDDPAIQPYPFQEPGQNFDGIVKLCEFPQMFDFSTLRSEERRVGKECRYRCA